jgi:ribosomal protein S27AE
LEAHVTKRKAQPITGPTLDVALEKVGNRELVACLPCGGFGAIMLDDGDWKPCGKCGGGGRVWKEAVDVR